MVCTSINASSRQWAAVFVFGMVRLTGKNNFEPLGLHIKPEAFLTKPDGPRFRGYKALVYRLNYHCVAFELHQRSSEFWLPLPPLLKRW